MNLKYPDDWSHTVAESSHNLTIVRANLTTEVESCSWVSKFGNLNRVAWILNHKYWRSKIAKRFISHRRWLCQRNSHGKVYNSKRNTGCPMSVDIKIKLVTRNTKDTDKFLKLVPPLQAVIKIEGAHNHPIDTAESLRLLRPREETKAQYVDYFNNGLSINDAMQYHEEKLRSSGASVIDFADASINPTRRMVQNLYDHYRSGADGNHGDPLEGLQDSSQLRENMSDDEKCNKVSTEEDADYSNYSSSIHLPTKQEHDEGIIVEASSSSLLVPVSKLNKKKTYRCAGDFKNEDKQSPKNMERVVMLLKNKSIKQRKMIKNLQKKNASMKKQIATLNESLKELQNEVRKLCRGSGHS